MGNAGGIVSRCRRYQFAITGGIKRGKYSQDITDVEADVSEHHAAVRWDDVDSCWKVRDLGSTNGTAVVSALTGEEHPLAPGEECALTPGDELRLGSQTVFAAIEGVPGVLDEAWS